MVLGCFFCFSMQSHAESHGNYVNKYLDPNYEIFIMITVKGQRELPLMPSYVCLTVQESRVPVVAEAAADALGEEGGHVHPLHLSDRDPHGRHPKGRRQSGR